MRSSLIVLVAGLVLASRGPCIAAPAGDLFQQVEPLLRKHCVKCHAGTRRKGGFSLNSLTLLLAGGESGPVVQAGSASDSYLIDLVSEPDPDLRMPQEGPALTADQVQLLSDWINAGVPWRDGFVFGHLHARSPIALRPVELPAVDGVAHPIDRLMNAYFAEHDLSPPPTVDDRVFARRVHLDLIGLLPTTDQLARFEASSASDKRARLVRELLADRRSYTDHWLTFWNDLLRNAYRGPGFIDNGRAQVTAWLYKSLYDNKPYDRMAHELIHPVSGSEGFVRGIKWRGTVNDSQRWEMQAAQNVAQVFLGTNLKCASCHDSFVNNWKVTEAYGLAAVFTDQRLQVHRCNKATGTWAEPGFIYPELGSVDRDAPVDARMQQLADMIVQSRDGRFARTLVNRLWARLMGRGLVEPLDDLDAEPWHDGLLEWLAADLIEHGYDIKHTLEQITTSEAYQLPALDADSDQQSDDFVFRGPAVKRMTAEQLIDAVCRLTGHWPDPTSDMLRRDSRQQGGQLSAVRAVLGDQVPSFAATEAKWIWAGSAGRDAPAGQTARIRYAITLDEIPASLLGVFSADNQFTLFVNGQKVAEHDDWQNPLAVELRPWIAAGRNVVAIRATNGGTGPNPAGFIADVAVVDTDGRILERLVSNGSWRATLDQPDRWWQPDFDDSAWNAAVEVAAAGSAPWAIADRMVPVPQVPTAVRAVLFMDDPLNRALGRPDRNQVVSQRESLATTLQAMELTNGQTLDTLLANGARQCLTDEVAVEDLVEAALGRTPTEEEKRTMRSLAGTPVTEQGLADVLWCLIMLPEFQLIH